MGIKLSKTLQRFAKGESGAAIVEYGVALLVVGAIGVGAFTFLGTETNQAVIEACKAISEDASSTC